MFKNVFTTQWWTEVLATAFVVLTCSELFNWTWWQIAISSWVTVILIAMFWRIVKYIQGFRNHKI